MRPITNSERACFQTCERLWQYTYLERREPLVPAETLNRGKRTHVSLASWWSSGGQEMRADAQPPAEQAMLIGYAARWQRPHLHNVQVNVPFRVAIGGVDVVGELDAMGTDDEGRTVIVEHKTTTSDIDPGSLWWREKVTTDPQPSTYLAAFPGATVLYDVLRVPSLRQYQAGKTRKVAETDSEYIARVLEDMSESPGKYFQRATVVRLEEEHRAHASDLSRTWVRMNGSSYNATPRNPRACFTYGRQCDFFAACWEGRSIESYPHREKNHSEEVLERWEASQR